MKAFPIALVLIFVFAIPQASALTFSELKTVEKSLGYVAQPSANQNYVKSIVFDPPDGAKKIYSVEVEITGDFQANTAVNAKALIGQSLRDCTPDTWTTPNMDTPNYRMTFDCLDLVNEYNVTTFDTDFGFRLNKVAQNVKARLIVTYYSDSHLPEIIRNQFGASMAMFGTEYEYGQIAKTWLQLLDTNNTEINAGVCYVNVFYPDETYFIENSAMILLDHGVYTIDFDAPLIGGVYPVVAECYFDSSQNKTYITDYWTYLGSYVSGTVNDTTSNDDSYLKFKEPSGGGDLRFEIGYNISQMCDYDQALTTGLSVRWRGKWDSATNDDITISLWNHTGNYWINLTNKITPQAGERTVTNSLIDISNFTVSGITNDTNGDVIIKFEDSNVPDTSRTDFYTDEFWVSCDQLADSEWQIVRGSSEIHINSPYGQSGYIIEPNGIAFVNSTSPSTPEGDIHMNFTLYSRTLEDKEVDVQYTLPPWIVCDDIDYLEWYNESAGEWVFYNYTSTYRNWSCSINFDDDLTTMKQTRILSKNEISKFQLHINNHIKRNVIKNNLTISHISDSLSLLCTLYFAYVGYGALPSVPLSSYPNYVAVDGRNDNIANNCAYFFHLKYYANQTISEIGEINITDIDDLNTYESHAVLLDRFADITQKIYMNIVSSLGIVADYSELPPAGLSFAIDTFTSLSTNGRLYAALTTGTALVNITDSNALTIWNFTNRTINSDESTFVGGTEYTSNETGEVATQLLTLISGNPSPVNTASCNVTIYYPNGTAYISDANAHYLPGTDGIYFYNFTIPSTQGVYESQFYCLNGAKDYYSSGTFHVSAMGASITSIESLVTEINTTAHEINSTAYMIEDLAEEINLTTHNISETLQESVIPDLQTIKGYTNNIKSLSLSAISLLDCTNSTADSICYRVSQINTTANHISDNVTTIISNIETLNGNMGGNFTQVFSSFSSLDGNLTEIDNFLTSMNVTLQGTYDNTIDIISLLDCSNSTSNTVCDKMNNITSLIVALDINATEIIGILDYINQTRWNNLTINDIYDHIDDAITGLSFNTTEILSHLDLDREFSEEAIFMITDSVSSQLKARAAFDSGDMDATITELRNAEEKLNSATKILSADISKSAEDDVNYVLAAIVAVLIGLLATGIYWNMNMGKRLKGMST